MFNHYYITVDKVNDNHISRIPKILHMVWVGAKNPPEYFHTNLTKWRELMPDWEFMVWTNEKLSLEHFDADYLKFIKSAPLGVQKADIVRYYVVWKYGGFYVDADILPKRSLNDLLTIDSELIICHDLPVGWGYIINAFFGATPNQKALNDICVEIFNCDLESKDIHLHTGPRLFGDCIISSDSSYAILHPHAFYRNQKGDSSLGYENSRFIEVSNSLFKAYQQLNDLENDKSILSFIISQLEQEKIRLFDVVFNSGTSTVMDYDVNWRFGSHTYAKDWFE